MKKAKLMRWIAGAALTLIAGVAGANGRVCFGPGIGIECRVNSQGHSAACVGCVMFTCDANCDAAQDYYLCIVPALPFCYGLGVKPTGAGGKSVFEKGHEPHPPEDRPEPVLRAHADGRVLQYYLEKGDATSAHLFVEVLLPFYRLRGGTLLTPKQQEMLTTLDKNPGLDPVMKAKVTETLDLHRTLKQKRRAK